MKKQTELLAPCGNFDCVKAAVNAGADAVYLGGRAFGARAYAANFDNEALEQVCELCHSYGVKVYVTVNTLYKDEEFSELIPFIDALYAMGVDGLIMQDLGAICMVRKFWPDLPVHASTQLTANSLDDVKELESMGIRTVVLSRELSLKEIKYIAENTDVRIEVFVHGALCVSYSGQCLMSSVLGNRSGNRGKCAQNCRLSYELLRRKQVLAGGHLLSTKDICTLPMLPKLLSAGAVSLKIEGRMKSPEYVAGVTGIYRKYLDVAISGSSYEVDPKDILILEQLFNRGAFSRGYLETHSGVEMMCPVHPKHWGVYAGRTLSYDRKKQIAGIRFDKDMVAGDGIEIRTEEEDGIGGYLNQAVMKGKKTVFPVRGDIHENQAVYQTYDKRLMDALKMRYEKVTRKVPLEVSIRLHSGEPSELSLTAGDFSACVHGEIPDHAQNQPLTVESVTAQIGKLGNTIYKAESIQTDLEEGLYLNKSSLNALKNQAVELLKNETVNSYKRISKTPELFCNSRQYTADARLFSVGVRNPEQFAAAAAFPLVSVIYLEMNDAFLSDVMELTAAAHQRNKKIMVRLPRIWRGYIRDNISEWLKLCTESEIDGFLISSLGHYHAVKDSGKGFSLDFTANVLNSRSYAFWNGLGAESIALSVEMSRDEINAISDHSRTEILAYGYIPLMVTHQCPIGNFVGKKENHIHCGNYNHAEGFRLRSGKDLFHLETDCRNCLCTITGERPLDIRDDINSFKVKTFRLNFTDESFEITAEILKNYSEILSSGIVKTSERGNIYDKTVL